MYGWITLEKLQKQEQDEWRKANPWKGIYNELNREEKIELFLKQKLWAIKRGSYYSNSKLAKEFERQLASLRATDEGILASLRKIRERRDVHYEPALSEAIKEYEKKAAQSSHSF